MLFNYVRTSTGTKIHSGCGNTTNCGCFGVSEMSWMTIELLRNKENVFCSKCFGNVSRIADIEEAAVIVEENGGSARNEDGFFSDELWDQLDKMGIK